METKLSNDYLKMELEKRLSANPNYSLRAFARFLNLSPGVLSEILNGKRKISLKTAVRISKALAHQPVECSHFLGLVNQDLGVSDHGHVEEIRNLSTDVFQVIADWYHFAILNLAECDQFRWSFSWIAKRLGISMLTAKTAVEKLVKVELVRKKGNSYQLQDDWVQSPDGIPSEAIKKYHRSMLEKASEALDFQKVEERDISGIGFALDPKHVNAIKEDIKEFQNKLLKKYSKGQKSEVYQLEMALFRITTGDNQ